MKLPNLYANTIKKRPIDMTLSENPLGCSPRAIQAVKQISVEDIAGYTEQGVLLETAAKRFAIATDNLLIGNGSEQLIKFIAQTFLTVGDTALVQTGSFSLFTKECILTGARVSLLDIRKPKRIRQTPKLIFLCNPNNPTGELLSADSIQNIISLFPKTVIIIDEANAEFTDTTCIPRAVKNKNVLVLRTCSKALGLAGLRIGFCIGNTKRILELKSKQQVFPISSPSVSIASAALQDTAFLQKTIAFMAKERTFVRNALLKEGFTVSESVTNTLFVSTPASERIMTTLNTLGVSVIAGTFFPGLTTPGFRIALRDRKTNRLFLEKLRSAIETLGINLLR